MKPANTFSVGDRVIHTTNKKRGMVLEYIGGSEKRYYVRHSGFVWSIPELCLQPILPSNKINNLEEPD